MKAVALLVVVTSACSQPDPCEQVAAAYANGLARRGPHPEMVRDDDPMVRHVTAAVANACRDDAWPAAALECLDNPRCLVLRLDDAQRRRFQEAIVEGERAFRREVLAGPPPGRAP